MATTRDSVYVDVIADTKKSVMSMAKLVAGIGVAIMAVRRMVAEVKKSVDAYLLQEKALTKLNAALKATGNAVGITTGEMQKYATALSHLTGMTDESIHNAQALMVTFTQVGAEVFPRAIEAASDMSVMFGQDLQQSIIQLGTALNDPIAGVGRLRRIGISFNQTQKDSIASFMEQNDLMSAQAVILDELNIEFGGIAKAVGETAVGAFNKLKSAQEDLREEAGALVVEGLKPIAEWLTVVFRNATEAQKQIRLVNEAMRGERGTDREKAQAKLNALIQQQADAIASTNTMVRAQGAILQPIIDAQTEHVRLLQMVENMTGASTQAAKDTAIAEAAIAKERVEQVTALTAAYAETEAGQEEALLAQEAYFVAMYQAGELSEKQITDISAVIIQLRKDIEDLNATQKPSFGGGGGGGTAGAAPDSSTLYLGADELTTQTWKAAEAVKELDEGWAALGETLEGIAADSMVALGSAFGEALVAGEDAWAALAEAGKDAIAIVLEALAKQFAVESIAAFAALNIPGGVGFAAAAVAAGVAAGAVRAMAEGGIVTSPTLALVGEKGPEAVIPLSGPGANLGTVIYNIRGSYIAERDLDAKVDRGMARRHRGH